MLTFRMILFLLQDQKIAYEAQSKEVNVVIK